MLLSVLLLSASWHSLARLAYVYSIVYAIGGPFYLQVVSRLPARLLPMGESVILHSPALET